MNFAQAQMEKGRILQQKGQQSQKAQRNLFQGKLAEGGSRLVFSDGDVGRLDLLVLKERGAGMLATVFYVVPCIHRGTEQGYVTLG